MKKLILLGVALIMGFGFSVSAFASTYIMSWDFLYNKPYAEQVALSIAQAQAKLEKEPRDPLERFREMLTRQILYRITRQIVDEAFGEDELKPGQYIVGDYVIDIFTDGVITVIITDTVTGNTTTIEVPYYDYDGFSE